MIGGNKRLRNPSNIIIAFMLVAFSFGVLKNVPRFIDSTFVGQELAYKNSADSAILDRTCAALPIVSTKDYAFKVSRCDRKSSIDNIYTFRQWPIERKNIQYVEESDSGSYGGKRLGVIVLR